MGIEKLVRKRVKDAVDRVEQAARHAAESGHVDRQGDVNIVSAVNVAQHGTGAAASTRQDVDIVQNGRRTHVSRKTP
jgi:hypothetical protein